MTLKPSTPPLSSEAMRADSREVELVSRSTPPNPGDSSQVELNTDRSKKRVPLGASMLLAFNYVKSDFRRNYRSFFIGGMSVFLVVFFLTFLSNVVSVSNIIFFKWAEQEIGECDVILRPRDFGGLPFINYTRVKDGISGNKDVLGGVGCPRWYFPANLTNQVNVPGTPPVLASDPPVVTQPVVPVPVFLALGDTKAEIEAKFGRDWAHRTPLGQGEAHISVTALRSVNVSAAVGERVQVDCDLIGAFIQQGTIDDPGSLRPIFDALFGSSLNFDDVVTGAAAAAPPVNINTTVTIDPAVLNPFPGLVQPATAGQTIAFTPTQAAVDALSPDLSNNGAGNIDPLDVLFPVFLQALRLSEEFTVVEAVGSPVGKWPSSFGNVVFADSNWINRRLQSQLYGAIPALPANLQAPFRDAVKGFTLESIAMSVSVNHKDRLDLYPVLDLDSTHDVITEFGNELLEDAGLDLEADVTLPILWFMEGTQFVILLLSTVFTLCLELLVLLGGLVVYSLLLGDVEEKTYEYGMLKALGMDSRTLVFCLGMNSVFFAVPAIAAAMLAALLFNIPVAIILANFAQVPPRFGLSDTAVAYGIVVGMMFPALANIQPIKKALGKTLRDSLDMYRKSSGEASVLFTKLEELGISPGQTALSLMLVLFGFIVYYLVPYSFIFRDFALFFLVMNQILIGMQVGTSILSIFLQPYLQEWFLGILLCCWAPFMNKRRIRGIHSVILKNFAGHATRNTKTAMMLTLTVSFLIFAGMALQLQAGQIRQNLEMVVGADVVVEAYDYAEPLDTVSYSRYLRTQLADANVSELTNSTFDPEVDGNASWYDEENPLYTKLTSSQCSTAGVTGSVALQGYDASSFNEAPDLNRRRFERALAQFLGQPVTATNVEVTEVTTMSGPSLKSAKVSFTVFDLRPGPSGEVGSELVLGNLTDLNATLFSQALVAQGLGDTSAAEVIPGSAAEPEILLVCCGRGNEVYGSCVCDDGAFGSDCSLEQAVLPPTQPSRRVVKDFTYLTYELRRIPGISGTSLSNLAGDPQNPVRVLAAEQNFMSVAFDEYYMPTEVDTRDIGLKGSGGGTEMQQGDLPLEYQVTPKMGQPDVLDSLYRHTNVTSGSKVVKDTETGDTQIYIPPAAILGETLSAPLNKSAWDPSAQYANGVTDPDELTCFWNPGKGDGDGKGAWKPCGPVDVRSETQEYLNQVYMESMTVIISESLRKAMSTDTETLMSLSINSNVSQKNTLVKPRAMLMKAPALFGEFSGQGVRQFNTGVMVNLEDYEKLVNSTVGGGKDTVRFQKLLVRFVDDVTQKEREELVNGLRTFILNSRTGLTDLSSLLQTVAVVYDMIILYMNVISFVAMTLCFFILWVSFKANIRENAWEFGVLRSVGVDEVSMWHIYVLEAMALTCAALFVGILIGCGLAITLTLQLNMFVEMPFQFMFPTSIVVTVIVCCLGLAYYGSKWPALALCQAKIATVLRNGA